MAQYHTDAPPAAEKLPFTFTGEKCACMEHVTNILTFMFTFAGRERELLEHKTCQPNCSEIANVQIFFDFVLVNHIQVAKDAAA